MESVFKMASSLRQLIHLLKFIQTYSTVSLTRLSHALWVIMGSLDALHKLIVLVFGDSLLPLHQANVHILTADFRCSAQHGRIDHHTEEHHNQINC